tara:strand:- start:728 stop:1840 length:1113 start_codon:yes stop_codon:yes gene_type:complete
MKLNYTINKEKHSVIFCKQNNISILSKSISSIHSDRNILFIYDRKINTNIVNEIIYELKLSGCNIIKIECEGDKINKNEKLLFKILDILLANKFTKKSILISFGGGVIGDVSALASSLYLRGLSYICIPTTMTSIVDSSVGGKTAINYKGITNSIGTYYHPRLVFILESIIESLPEREFFAGIPEIIKCGVIGDKKILNLLKSEKENIIKRKINLIFKICYLTLKTKINFFKDDIFEKKKRLSLNFGHTFAHAIEMAVEQKINKDFIRHGEAVGIGMLCEIFYEKGKKEKIYQTIEEILKKFNLPTFLSLDKIPMNKIKLQNSIFKKIFLDKKKLDKYPRFISVKNFCKTTPKEIRNFDLLNDTISKILL